VRDDGNVRFGSNCGRLNTRARQPSGERNWDYAFAERTPPGKTLTRTEERWSPPTNGRRVPVLQTPRIVVFPYLASLRCTVLPVTTLF